ncbi:hypothetical protein ACSS6W_002448 [Trichoderma asperelloides]|nr:hypothetical protein LI328DRAFT_147451 [Trichoderma asperelloides]
MHGFEWQNQRGIKGTGFVRALQSLLTSRLLKFQLDAERLVKESLQIAFQDVHSDGKCRRKALASYTFQDGSTINRGDWVCIPRQAMMQDGTRHKEPPDAYLMALDSCEPTLSSSSLSHALKGLIRRSPD